MFKFIAHTQQSPDITVSELYDENTFYDRFTKDLKHCKYELIIESPYITSRRLDLLLPELRRLKSKRVKIIINTRDPETHDNYLQVEARNAISELQHMGVQVLYTEGHHRKLAILDRNILYEGSLNILSQNNSCEVMRRMVSTSLSWQMTRFLKIDNYVQ